MIKVYFDGACTPNPGGIISYGAVIIRHEEVIYEISQKGKIHPEKATNNVAEYCSLIAAMKYLIFKDLQFEEIYFFGDSLLVINQMKGLWEIKDGKYKGYAEISRDIARHFSDAHFEWIPRERNERADLLSRRALGV